MKKRAEPMFKNVPASSTSPDERAADKAAINVSDKKNENVLVAVSISLLYEGMVVHDDIYDSTGNRLLITGGNVLSQTHIERVKKLNSGNDTIHVTGRTHKNMLAKRPNIDIDSRSEVEESTGYKAAKDSTFELLEEMASKKSIDMNSLHAVSDELSSRLESTPQPVIISLINAMAPVDEYLQRHCVNVGLLNGLIGRWMGLSDVDIDRLVLIGLLHDCGKTMLPPKVLNSPRALTAVEYEVIKKHADYTYDLLHEFPQKIRIASSSHHERVNGSGYSRKLKKNDIMLEARITAISDTYDAIVSRRIYQTPKSPFCALALLEEQSVDLYDCDIVRIFVEQMPKELMDKPVMMSDGKIAVLRGYDPDDINFPTVELGNKIIKSHEGLNIASMFNDD